LYQKIAVFSRAGNCQFSRKILNKLKNSKSFVIGRLKESTNRLQNVWVPYWQSTEVFPRLRVDKRGEEIGIPS